MTKLQKLEERIRELVPEIFVPMGYERINLEHVLQAFESVYPSTGLFGLSTMRMSYIEEILRLWKLSKPIDCQPEELIDFLYEVFYPDNNNEDE